MTKLKVCHLTSAHADGDIRIYHKECVSLAKNGFEVYQVVPNSTSRLTAENVNIVSFETPKSSRLKRMLNTTKLVYEKALEINADVYHFHDPELLRFALKLKKRGKIVIYDAHEDVPRQILGKPWINSALRKLIAFCFEKYENYIAKRLSYVVVSTPTIKKRFVEINSNTEAICNYPMITENSTEPNWSAKKEEICYLGGLTEIRGIREVIEAMDAVGACRLNLAGVYSPLEFRDELVKLSGWEKVNELGYLGRKEVVEVLNRSKIGLVTLYPQPNYLDSLPIKMFEYMLAGIPVIASDFPLWKSIIDDSNCGICIDPKNPASISDAINLILLDSNKARELGENGRKAVLEKYNWEQEEIKLVNIYHSLLSKRNL